MNKGWLGCEMGRIRCRTWGFIPPTLARLGQVKSSKVGKVKYDINSKRDAVRCCRGDYQVAKRATLAWVRTIVVDLPLCPFAESVVEADTLRVTVSRATREDGIRKAIISEIEHLLSVSRNVVATCLLVTPDFCCSDFVRFAEFCEEMEQQVENDETLVDQVVLAWFHPEFQWSEVESDDVINFDKRAPYPTINLLRADELDEYIAKGKTQHILEMNQKTLQRVGVERMNQLYRNLT